MSPKLKIARTSSTIFVYDATTAAEVEKKIARAIQQGECQHLPNGDRIWESWEAIHDSTQEGSAAFQWDRAGNKVRCRLIRYTLTHDKKLSSVEVRRAFRPYDSLWD